MLARWRAKARALASLATTCRAVDTQHHLIVAHEVTNVGSDRHQLKRMSERAREALGSQELTALADRGYYSGEEIKACDDAGIPMRMRRQTVEHPFGTIKAWMAPHTSCVDDYPR